MSTLYYGAAQFQTILEQRHHDDSFFTELILINNRLDQDLADSMRADIIGGNTATLKNHYKSFAKEAPDYAPAIYDGVDVPDAPFHGEIPSTEHTLYGMVPIKDDYSFQQGVTGYHLLPDSDSRKIQTEEALDALKMNADDIIESILEPEAIGAVGSPEFSDYEKAWNGSPDLQATYPTIESYQAALSRDQAAQQDQISDLTDIYIGIYATGGTLSETNRNTIYFTMANIFPKITFNGLTYTSPHDDLPPLSYVYQYVSGYFMATCGWHGWSYVIREGIVQNEFDTTMATSAKKGKSSHRIVLNAGEAQISITDGDPIYQTIVENQLELNGWMVNGQSAGTGMLEIQVQLPAINGVSVYGEIRVWDYTTLHTNLANNGTDVVNIKAGIGGGLMPAEGSIMITTPDTVTVADGSVDILTVTSDDPDALLGFSADELNTDAAAFTIDPNTGVMTANAPLDYAVQNVYYVQLLAQNETTQALGFKYLTIHVENTNSEPEPPEHMNPFGPKVSKGPDLVFFPIEYEAARKVPFFRRERFIREAVVLGMYNVTEVEVAWYQSGWFKVVMFIVAVVILVLSGGSGFAALLEIKTVITAAATIAFSMVVAEIVMNTIDNPMLAAALVIIIGVMTGNFNFTINMSNLSNLASLALEATNTYIKKYFAEKMEELQKEILEWQKKMEAAEKELAELAAQVGDMGLEDSADVIQFLASLTQPESTREFFNRTTNLNNAIITDVRKLTDVTQLLKLY